MLCLHKILNYLNAVKLHFAFYFILPVFKDFAASNCFKS